MSTHAKLPTGLSRGLACAMDLLREWAKLPGNEHRALASEVMENCAVELEKRFFKEWAAEVKAAAESAVSQASTGAQEWLEPKEWQRLFTCTVRVESRCNQPAVVVAPQPSLEARCHEHAHARGETPAGTPGRLEFVMHSDCAAADAFHRENDGRTWPHIDQRPASAPSADRGGTKDAKEEP